MSEEQRMRYRRMAALNKQKRFTESLKLYLDAHSPRREVWDAYQGLVDDAVEIRACLREAQDVVISRHEHEGENMLEKNFRLPEVSELTGYSVSSLRRMVRLREIGSRKIGRIVCVPASEIKRLLAQHPLREALTAPSGKAS